MRTLLNTSSSSTPSLRHPDIPWGSLHRDISHMATGHRRYKARTRIIAGQPKCKVTIREAKLSSLSASIL